MWVFSQIFGLAAAIGNREALLRFRFQFSMSICSLEMRVKKLFFISEIEKRGDNINSETCKSSVSYLENWRRNLKNVREEEDRKKVVDMTTVGKRGRTFCLGVVAQCVVPWTSSMAEFHSRQKCPLFLLCTSSILRWSSTQSSLQSQLISSRVQPSQLAVVI